MKDEFVTILRVFINSIKALTESEVEALLIGDGKLVYIDVKKGQQKDCIINDDLKWYYEKIKTLKTREEVALTLEELKKINLFDICTYYHIPFLKSDTKQKLIRRIIDNQLGIKLCYEALRKE